MELDTIAGTGDPRGMVYPGGKNGAGVYQKLINLMPPHDAYIEPFLGSGAVMRLKRPALVNVGLDLDGAVLDRASALLAMGDRGGPLVRNGEGGSGPGGIVKSGERGGSGIVKTGDARSRSVASGTASSKVARLAGIVRSGEGVLLPGARHHHSPELTRAAAWRFERRCGIEYLELASPFPASTLIYCDPPYLMSTRRSDRPIYRHELEGGHHRRLLRCLLEAGCMVMLSGYWSRMYASALKGWNSISFESMTRAGITATEWVWFNFAPPVELHDYRFLGRTFRERERIKRKTRRWTARLGQMPTLERQCLYAAMKASIAGNGVAADSPETAMVDRDGRGHRTTRARPNNS